VCVSPRRLTLESVRRALHEALCVSWKPARWVCVELSRTSKLAHSGRSLAPALSLGTPPPRKFGTPYLRNLCFTLLVFLQAFSY
jgi:hypothetical protein